MGSGYGGGLRPEAAASLKANIAKLATKYPLTASGKFGTKVSQGVHLVHATDPHNTAKEFFEKLTIGRPIAKLSNGKGLYSKFIDGSRVNFRPNSSSGGPAVDIHIAGEKTSSYKIHFEPIPTSERSN